MSMFEDVCHWHKVFSISSAEQPTTLNDDRRELRIALHDEELCELHQAMVTGDLPGIADGIADLIWVLCGTAAEHGIPLDHVWHEVRRANWDKLPDDGVPILRHDGKILKPEGWQPPNIAGVLAAFIKGES